MIVLDDHGLVVVMVPMMVMMMLDHDNWVGIRGKWRSHRQHRKSSKR
jgi:hypothetical protein